MKEAEKTRRKIKNGRLGKDSRRATKKKKNRKRTCKSEKEIEKDFSEALIGIKKLPASSRGGVYLAYVYYRSLLNKIKNAPPHKILNGRIRINNGQKFGLMINSLIQHKMNLV